MGVDLNEEVCSALVTLHVIFCLLIALFYAAFCLWYYYYTIKAIIVNLLRGQSSLINEMSGAKESLVSHSNFFSYYALVFFTLNFCILQCI